MTNQLCFHQQWDRLYKKLVQQIAGYETTATDEKKWIEWGFGITSKAWFSIQEKMEDHSFADQYEEISFYKNLKPKFIGLIDFFTLLYRGILFQPDNNAEKKDYWKRELSVCRFFLLKHQPFCRYYEQGNTGMDHIYFVQQNNQQPLIFGINENKGYRTGAAITSYSFLLARVISITRYQRYLQEKIGFLTNSQAETQN